MLVVHSRDRPKNCTLFTVLVAKYCLQKPSRPCSSTMNACLKSLNRRVLVFLLKHFFKIPIIYFTRQDSGKVNSFTRNYKMIFQIFLSRSATTLELCFLMQLQDMNQITCEQSRSHTITSQTPTFRTFFLIL